MSRQPQLPTPEDQPEVYARALALIIAGGGDGTKMANDYLIVHGPAMVRACAILSAAEMIESFRDDPDDWKYLQPVENKLHAFFSDMIARCKEIATNLPAETVQ